MLILNGKQRQDYSRNFVHKGTKFVYLVESNGESLSAPGPLMDDVEVMVSLGQAQFALKLHIDGFRHLNCDHPILIN